MNVVRLTSGYDKKIHKRDSLQSFSRCIENRDKPSPDYEKLKSDEAEVTEENNILSFSCIPSVYFVSIVIDYVRHLLLDAEKTFSFETVFSHPSKAQLMEDAQQKGYKIYLYFVCTNSPDINVLRVKQRTEEGGTVSRKKKYVPAIRAL